MRVRGRHSANLAVDPKYRALLLVTLVGLVGCGTGAVGEPAGWAGADALRSGRGVPDATAASDAAAEACAAVVDAPAEAQAVEPPPTDAGADDADAAQPKDGKVIWDVPSFDAIADFSGWDGGDLGTPAFDGAVFQELPPFADATKPDSAFDAGSMGDAAAEPGPEVSADAASEIADAGSDPGPDLPPTDTAEVGFDAAADAPAETGSTDAAMDQQVAEVSLDAADAAPDAPKDVQAETAVDTKSDTAPETTGDATQNDVADSAEVLVDTQVEVQAEGLVDGTADIAGDLPADAVADAQPDAAPETDSGGEPCTAQNCDDGEPCTIDLCGMGGGCTHLPLDDGDPCAEGTCQQALCSRNTPATYGLSCKAIKAADAKAKSGVWWLDPDGPFTPISPFAAWCDMEGDGGGWTLLAKIAATKSELGYDAAYWTTIATLHPELPRFDDREARLNSYWSLPFSQLRVGLKATKQTTWLVANLQGSSLFHVIVQGKFVQLSVPEANWLGLLPGAQLLAGCRVQGFNAHPGVGTAFDYARARVGIVASASADCTTPGSRIGIGLGGTTCGQSAAIAAGGAAGCLDTGGPLNLPATGYLFAR